MSKFKLARILLLVGIASIVAGCKLVIMVDSAGRVTAGASQGCDGPAVCEINIVDEGFTSTYTAVPNHGYEFVRWQDGTGFVCAGSVNPDCRVSLDGLPSAAAIVASRAAIRLSPVFREADIDTDDDGTPDVEDADDDNDGIDDEFDTCPLDAPADLPNGCPDGDGDGIADKDDQCPGLGGDVVDIFGCPGVPIEAADIVNVDGVEWAQPDLFLDVSWNQANATCPGGTCGANAAINGHKVEGWTWASVENINALVNHYQAAVILGPGPSSFTHVPGTDLALPAMVAAGFRPTSATQGYLLGFTSTPNSAFRAYRGTLYPQSFSVKWYATSQTSDKDYTNPWTGLWLYR